MLEPQDRHLFLDAFRPPAGYILNYALGTTFSLDLLTLLAVPMALTALDWQAGEVEDHPDALAVLEGLRRNADRMCLFCQAGRIALPKRYQTLFGYLEDLVFEVIPPNQQRVFHPKVWVLRFAASNESVLYRLLVLSRNLTFDRSWDVILSLEGELVPRKNAFARNHPLGDFVATLPELVVRRAVPKQVLTNIDRVQEEIRRVRFSLPDGFDEVRFWPLGISGKCPWPFEGRKDRMLIVSPFVTKECLYRLTESGAGHILVSRQESIEQVPDVSRQFDKLFVLNDSANPDVVEPNLTGPEELDNYFPLTGLHAKLYVADAGWDARVWMGSANATDAAFDGNIEFLVELQGKKSRCGVDAVLGRESGRGAFLDLLQEYPSSPDSASPDSEQEALDSMVEEGRRELGQAQLIANVMPATSSQGYDLGIYLMEGHSLRIPGDIEVSCRPITLPAAEAVALKLGPDNTGDGSPLVVFHQLPLEAITSFFAFTVKAISGAKSASINFILNLPLEGVPEGRHERILRTLLRNRHQVLRYLLLLLADEGFAIQQVLSGPRSSSVQSTAVGLSPVQLPLFEALVRTLHRCPERLDQVAQLVEDLRKTPDGTSLLPNDFQVIWDPIWAARGRLKG